MPGEAQPNGCPSRWQSETTANYSVQQSVHNSHEVRRVLVWLSRFVFDFRNRVPQWNSSEAASNGGEGRSIPLTVKALRP